MKDKTQIIIGAFALIGFFSTITFIDTILDGKDNQCADYIYELEELETDYSSLEEENLELQKQIEDLQNKLEVCKEERSGLEEDCGYYSDTHFDYTDTSR